MLGCVTLRPVSQPAPMQILIACFCLLCLLPSERCGLTSVDLFWNLRSYGIKAVRIAAPPPSSGMLVLRALEALDETPFSWHRYRPECHRREGQSCLHATLLAVIMQCTLSSSMPDNPPNPPAPPRSRAATISNPAGKRKKVGSGPSVSCLPACSVY